MVKKYFRRLRTFYWFLKSYFLRYLWIILLSFLFGIIFYRIFYPILKIKLSPKPVTQIGLIGTYSENDLPKEIQDLISLGLTSVTASGSARPAISSGWKISNSGKTYLFTLDKSLVWQDGRKFRAQDINYNFKDVLGTPVDAFHYEFTLKQAYSPFLILLSQPLFKRGLVGLGVYRVNQIEKSSGFLKSIKLESKNNILIYKIFPNEKSAAIAFKLGEIDILKGVSQTKEFKSFKNIKIEPELRLDTVVTLFFNTRTKKFNEKTYRQALTYAIPDQKMKEVRAYGPISPISWAYNENLKKYNFDLDEAMRLLAKVDEKLLKEKIVLSAVKPYDKYLSVIADSWRALGLSVETRVDNLIPNKFDVLIAGQEIFADPDQYVYWHSTSAQNLTGYFSAKVDKYLEDGRRTDSYEERLQKYLDFQKYLVDDAPAAFLYFPTAFNIYRTKLSGS